VLHIQILTLITHISPILLHSITIIMIMTISTICTITVVIINNTASGKIERANDINTSTTKQLGNIGRENRLSAVLRLHSSYAMS
jgi:hypothetical protein